MNDTMAALAERKIINKVFQLLGWGLWVQNPSQKRLML